MRALRLRREVSGRMVGAGISGGFMAVPVGGIMTRVLAVTACSFALAACSMSMPSLDIFKSTPASEVLRVESEPPGADARTSQGQSCRTPCELTVQSGGEMTVSFSLNGYQPQTVQVRPDVAPTSYSDSGRAAGCSRTRFMPSFSRTSRRPRRSPPRASRRPKKRPQRPQRLLQPACPRPARAASRAATPGPSRVEPR